MSPVPRLVHHAAAGDRGDDICVINKRGRLPTMYRRPDQDRALVLRIGTHPQCQMEISPLA
jgi:hypothetical protein